MSANASSARSRTPTGKRQSGEVSNATGKQHPVAPNDPIYFGHAPIMRRHYVARSLLLVAIVLCSIITLDYLAGGLTHDVRVCGNASVCGPHSVTRLALLQGRIESTLLHRALALFSNPWHTTVAFDAGTITFLARKLNISSTSRVLDIASGGSAGSSICAQSKATVTSVDTSAWAADYAARSLAMCDASSTAALVVPELSLMHKALADAHAGTLPEAEYAHYHFPHFDEDDETAQEDGSRGGGYSVNTTSGAGGSNARHPGTAASAVEAAAREAIALKRPPRLYDFAVAIGSPSHFDRPHDVLLSTAASLKVGGVVLLVVPSRPPTMWQGAVADALHYTVTVQEASQLLVESGFDDVVLVPVPPRGGSDGHDPLAVALFATRRRSVPPPLSQSGRRAPLWVEAVVAFTRGAVGLPLYAAATLLHLAADVVGAVATVAGLGVAALAGSLLLILYKVLRVKSEDYYALHPKLFRRVAELNEATAATEEGMFGDYTNTGFYDEGVDVSRWGRAGHCRAQRRMVTEVLQLLDDVPATASKVRVLDIGCGLGGPSRYLHEFFTDLGNEVEVVGISLSPIHVARATELAAEAGFNTAADVHHANRVSYTVANALVLPFADSSFDLVWSLEVVEQIPDKVALMHEVNRVLKPGGRVVVGTMCRRETSGVGGGGSLSNSEQRLLARLAKNGPYPPFVPASVLKQCVKAAGLRLNGSVRDFGANVAPFWPAALRSLASPRGIYSLILGAPFVMLVSRMLAVWRWKGVGYENGVLRFAAFSATKPGRE